MENKPKQQELEPWTPPTETVEMYQDLEVIAIKEGGPIDKIMVYTCRYPSILIFWAFLAIIVLAVYGIKDLPIYMGVLCLGGVGYIGSMIRRWNDDKQKRYRTP